MVLAGVIDASNTDLSKTYQVTLKFTTTDYLSIETETTVVYDIVIKNPCINQDYIKIVAVSLPAETYTIGTDEDQFDELTPSPFTVTVVLPATSNLCGALTFVPSYE